MVNKASCVKPGCKSHTPARCEDYEKIRNSRIKKYVSW